MAQSSSVFHGRPLHQPVTLPQGHAPVDVLSMGAMVSLSARKERTGAAGGLEVARGGCCSTPESELAGDVIAAATFPPNLPATSSHHPCQLNYAKKEVIRLVNQDA